MKTERIEMRVRQDWKEHVKRAADKLGVTLSQFIIEAAGEKAQQSNSSRQRN